MGNLNAICLTTVLYDNNSANGLENTQIVIYSLDEYIRA
jgi:hypothetical protein